MTISRDTGSVNLALAATLVQNLAAAGLRHVVICPGSRSTPLALAFWRCPEITVRVLVDERSAAFFALGMARASREPVALLCSSGTAAANFLPAVVEAWLSRVPLIVLTADRPPELQGWGAAQTIDQTALFGSHVKWFTMLPVPEDRPELFLQARAVAARAIAVALDAPAGPVHLNAPFREPLLPTDGETPVNAIPGVLARRPGRSLRQPDPVDIAHLAAELAAEPRGLIVAGPSDDPGLPEAAAGLSRATGYPLLADPLSDVRLGRHDRNLVVDGYDAFLRNPEARTLLQPGIILRVGGIPTSKPLLEFLNDAAPSTHALIDETTGWRDPGFAATRTLLASPALALAALADHPDVRGMDKATGWADQWQRINRETQLAIATRLGEENEFFEGRVFAELAEILPDGALLVAGNSMPVRDLDTFTPTSGKEVRFLANRGANGIDGVMSTALGAAAVHPGPVVLVIGDLSFYHDMNGLLAAKLHRLHATIVVLNNNGGGIFSFLPQASATGHETFEALFGTPIDLDPAKVAALYGAAFSRPTGWAEFQRDVRQSIRRDGLSIVEVVTDRERNVRQHRAVWTSVNERLAASGLLTA